MDKDYALSRILDIAAKHRTGEADWQRVYQLASIALDSVPAYRIEAIGDLPPGYHQADYFLDRGQCLDREYASEIEAINAWSANYKGRDKDGIGLTVRVTNAE